MQSMILAEEICIRTAPKIRTVLYAALDEDRMAQTMTCA